LNSRIVLVTSLVLLLWSECTHAQIAILDTEYLRKGVVRITAAPPGQNQKVGTGFIVRLEKDLAYIVTAAHVVSGHSEAFRRR
jgi:S1-C subfamily serine protease